MNILENLSFRDLRSMRAMLLEDSCRRELSELMADHVLCHKYGVENFAVVNQEGVADKIRCDGGTTRPRLDGLFVSSVIHLINLLEEMQINKGSFLK